MAWGPGKNLSAARVESAQLASQWPPRWKEWLGSGWRWSILQWSWIPNSALYDYWFRGRPARRMWQKRNSLFHAISTQFAQKCGWETWGMLKSKNQYVVTITTPLNHPHPKGVTDVVTFLRWKKSTGRFQALSPWSVHVLVQEAQVFHGHLRTVIGEVSGYSEDGQCMFMVQVDCR